MRFLIVEKVLTGNYKHSRYGNIRPLWSLAMPVAVAGIASGLVSGSLNALPSHAASVPIATPPAISSPVKPSDSPSPDSTDLFDRYFGSEANVARAIAKAENLTGDPLLVLLNSDHATLPDKPWKRYFPHGSEDYGVMQINLFWNWELVPGDSNQAKAQWLMNPLNNIQIAKQIRDDWGNITAWSTYNNRTYKQFLERN